MIINVARKKRSELLKGMERLCEAYITLAYMDATRHKTEKSEHSQFFLEDFTHFTGKPGKKAPRLIEKVQFAVLLCCAELLASVLGYRCDSHPCRSARHEGQRSGRGCHPHPGAEGEDQKIRPFLGVNCFPLGNLNNST